MAGITGVCDCAIGSSQTVMLRRTARQMVHANGIHPAIKNVTPRASLPKLGFATTVSPWLFSGRLPREPSCHLREGRQAKNGQSSLIRPACSGFAPRIMANVSRSFAAVIHNVHQIKNEIKSPVVKTATLIALSCDATSKAALVTSPTQTR